MGYGGSYSTLLFASASFPSLEQCKPLSRKQAPLTPGWTHWLRQADTLFSALSRTSSLLVTWEPVGISLSVTGGEH